MVSASHFAAHKIASALPAFVLPAAPCGGQENIFEETTSIDCRETRSVDCTEQPLRQKDARFPYQHEQYSDPQEGSCYATSSSNQGYPHSDDSPAPSCACSPRCQCKPACRYQIHSCPCAPCVPRRTQGGNENIPSPTSFKAAHQSSAQHISRKPVISNINRVLPDRSFGDGTLSRQKSQLTTAPRRGENSIGDRNAVQPHLKRLRAPTINSDLAYVPPAPSRTPSRKQKDATPLEFYGSHSGQRYPAFTTGSLLDQNAALSPPKFAAVPNTSQQAEASEHVHQSPKPSSNSQAGVIGQTVEPTLRSSSASCDSDEEAGAHAPSPLSAPRQRRFQCNETYAAITGEDVKSCFDVNGYAMPLLSDFNDLPRSSPAKVTYPAVPRSTSVELFPKGIYTPTATQSFPSAQVGNPRHADSTSGQTDDHAEESRGQSHHTCVHVDASVPTRHSSPASSSREFPPPLPKPLPLPDFIAPRPATKQRYVSAGGTAKLEDRPEITGFTLPTSIIPGISISRDVFLQHLDSVPHFTTPTRSMVDCSTPRVSEEATMGSSTRSSYEDGFDRQGTKRDRKESGSSQRLARLKRVFSFGREGKEDSSS